jgi:GT2 family glycosyltransferase
MPKWLDINGSMKFLKSVFVNRDDGDIEIEYEKGTISKNPGGVNMFFRRNIIEKNGYFRTDLGPKGKKLGFSEDTEYCQRLVKNGEKFMYIPSAIIYHSIHPERLNKKYLLHWQYNCGRSEVRRNGGYKNTIKFLGVPRYIYRKFLEHVVGWSLSHQSKKRFFHKLRLYYTTGELVEHFRINFKKGCSTT